MSLDRISGRSGCASASACSESVWLRVRPCAHHKLASAVWLELDAAEGSDLKTMQVFHIKEDDREQTNLAQSAVGKLQASRLLDVALKAKVTCSCFQGRCLTKDTCENDNGNDWARRHRSGEHQGTHHGNRKEVLQKVIAA